MGDVVVIERAIEIGEALRTVKDAPEAIGAVLRLVDASDPLDGILAGVILAGGYVAAHEGPSDDAIKALVEDLGRARA